MSFQLFRRRLGFTADELWSALDQVREADEALDLGTKERVPHDIAQRRLLAIQGVREMIDVFKKMQSGLARNKTQLTSGPLTDFIEFSVTFAQNAARREIQVLRDADEAFQNAAN